jgi:hypothetical protein
MIWDDLLTWDGVRALMSVEAISPSKPTVVLAAPHPSRPPIKWTSQRHWLDTVVPQPSRAGDLVWTRHAWRHPWRPCLLNAVTQPSVLVSTYYDPMIRHSAVAEMFRPGSQIRHWFGVQGMTTHTQFTAMPVGIEAKTIPVLKATEQRAMRDLLLYVNFDPTHAFMQIAPIRASVWAHFSTQPWATVESLGSLEHYAHQLGRAKFVLSPPGYGWDCYRTYEAIAMGAIPIVQRHSPSSDVCAGLPVLMVEQWHDVTPERLQREWETRQPGSLDTMTLGYWRQQIEAQVRSIA